MVVKNIYDFKYLLDRCMHIANTNTKSLTNVSYKIALTKTQNITNFQTEYINK